MSQPEAAPVERPSSTALDSVACERFLRDGVLHLPGWLGRNEVNEISLTARTVAATGQAPSEHLSDGFRSWRALTTVSTKLATLACDPRLVVPAIQLLGPAIRLMGTQLIIRSPHHGPRSVRTPERPGWHRDIFGMTADVGAAAPLCAIKFAIWLSDAPEVEHGATRFLPGSHLTGLPTIPAGMADPDGWVMYGPVGGDITLFENRISHAGGINSSMRDLVVLMLQYGHRWLAPVIHRVHNDMILAQLTAYGRQLLEPEDCLENEYRPGSGAQVIRVWAEGLGVGRYANPRT